MSIMEDRRWSRRELLGQIALAGVSGLVGLRAAGLLSGLSSPRRALAAEPPPEVSTINLVRNPSAPSLCLAPQYFAEEFLRAEGFKTVRYVGVNPADIVKAVAAREVDLTMHVPSALIAGVDMGSPITLLGGVHVGCYELFGTDRIRSIHDLKGKTIAAGPTGSGRQLFAAALLTYVGLNPRNSVTWITDPPAVAMRLLAEGKIDGFMGFPPEPQELRAKKIGHVLVNTMRDRPWSNYFCCFVAANRAFVHEHPVATKRALRAILRAADVCAREPVRVARFLVHKGYAERYDYALQAMNEIPYNRWREYDSEDTIRFHALRLLEAGLITSSPQKILAQGTDWRFLNSIKKERKGAESVPEGPFLHHRHG